MRSASTPSLNGNASQHDFSALKILRNLQGRVRELRADNRPYHGGSMEDLTMLRTDLGHSYRDKVSNLHFSLKNLGVCFINL